MKVLGNFALSSAFVLVAMSTLNCGSGDDDGEDACMPDDADGIAGGESTFEVTVSDTDFEPKILKVQNLENVTLTMKNVGSKPHSFVIDCLPTPNERGCPTESCMPPSSRVAPVQPNESTTVTFEVPRVEGIYTFRSDVSGDTPTGQFVVQ